MRLTPIYALAAVALVAGCRAEGRPDDAETAPPVERRDILATVPKLGRSLVTDTTGSEDAQKLVLFVRAEFDSVVQFYRTRLPQDSWRIMSVQSDSVSAMFRAERDSALLWVQIRKLARSATEYTLIAGSEPGQRPGPTMARP